MYFGDAHWPQMLNDAQRCPTVSGKTPSAGSWAPSHIVSIWSVSILINRAICSLDARVYASSKWGIGNAGAE